MDPVRLSITREARERAVEIPITSKLESEAIKWSHDKSKRCGRTACQFAKNYIDRFLLPAAK